MNNCYVDTNIIIARYKPEDSLHKYSQKIFQLSETNLYISPLTLLELHSVLSRVKNELIVPFVEEPLTETIIALIIKDCGLKVVSKSYTVRKSIYEYKFRAPIEYYLAMKFSDRLKRRTLDLLHLAYIWLLREEYNIGVFVTGDEEIIDEAEVINKVLKIKVLHPSQLQ